MSEIAITCTAALGSWLVVGLMIRRFGRHMLDRPNERSMHSMPTPRGGGVTLALAAVIALAVIPSGEGVVPRLVQVGLAALVAGIGFLDDVRNLSWRVRMAVHLVAAVGAMASWGAFDEVDVAATTRSLGPLGIALTLVWIVGLLNAYNFMDGIDGIAGAQALVASIAWCLTAWLGGEHAFASAMLVVAGAAVGFLVWNWSPARIFMGDVGSTTLGYFFAVAPLIAMRQGVGEPERVPWLALAAVFPFVYDAASTFVRRAVRRENVLAPHRTHTYQVLARAIGHRKVAASWASLAALTAGAGAATALGRVSVVGVWGAMAAAVVVIESARRWAEREERRKESR